MCVCVRACAGARTCVCTHSLYVRAAKRGNIFANAEADSHYSALGTAVGGLRESRSSTHCVHNAVAVKCKTRLADFYLALALLDIYNCVRRECAREE